MLHILHTALFLTDKFTRTLADRAAVTQRQAHRPGTIIGIEPFAFCHRIKVPYQTESRLLVYGIPCKPITNHLAHLRTYYRMARLGPVPKILKS